MRLTRLVSVMFFIAQCDTDRLQLLSPSCPVSSANGSVLCAVGQVLRELSDVSISRCTLEYLANPGVCSSVNYNQSGRGCVMHKDPTRYITGVIGCVTYQPQQSIYQGSPVVNVEQNCSFPFTYLGQLYYRCVQTVLDAANLCNKFAFIQPNSRNLATCMPQFASRLYMNQSVNISIPTFTDLTPVISVNNWIVFQQRIDSSTSFNLGWSDYRDGFGTFKKNFWLGLERVYQMTRAGFCRLRFEMLNDLDQRVSVEYSNFNLDNEAASYAIHLTGYYAGDLIYGDPMNSPISGWIQNGKRFSTTDRLGPGVCACPTSYGGGWWYTCCHQICLTGTIPGVGFAYDDYMAATGTQVWHFLTISRMMIKCD